MTNKERGYQYAQEYNAYLANNWHEPDDHGLADDQEFKDGVEQFHEELFDQP